MYQVLWTEKARGELQSIRAYLVDNWSVAHEQRLLDELEKVIVNIQKNPRLYPKVDKDYPLPVHKVNIQRFNSLYYAINDNEELAVILTFFSNRQSPDNLKF